jgi:hypothetical protein
MKTTADMICLTIVVIEQVISDLQLLIDRLGALSNLGSIPASADDAAPRPADQPAEAAYGFD